MATIEKRMGKDGKYNYRVKIRLKGTPPQEATFKRLTDAKTYVQQTEAAIREVRHFCLRSVGSSLFSEAFYSIMAIIMMEFATIPFKNIIQLTAISFGIKALYSLLLAFPANILVDYLKKITGIDVYDFPNKFTPFKYSKEPVV